MKDSTSLVHILSGNIHVLYLHCYIHNLLSQRYGVCGDVVVKALRYKAAGRGFDSPTVSLKFFIDIILPIALWPWGRLSL